MLHKLFRLVLPLLLAALLAACAPEAPEAPAAPGSGNPALPGSGLTPASAGPSGPAADPAGRAMGRYVEEAIPLPEGANLSRMAAHGGKLYSISADGSLLYVSGDYQTWETLDTGLAAIDSGYTADFALDEAGEIYILYVRYIREGEGDSGDIRLEYRLARGPVGAVEDIPLAVDGWGREMTGTDGKSYRFVDVNCVLPLSSGNFAIGSDAAGIYLFAPDGTGIRQISSEGVWQIARHGGEIACYTYRDDVLRVLNAETGETLRDVPFVAADDFILPQYDGEGALYYAAASGIYRSVPGGTLWERIVDGALTSLSKPSFQAAQLLFTPEGDPMIYAFDSSVAGEYAPALVRYRYDPDVPTEPEITLNLFALYDNEYLRACAALFQDRYPEVMVRFTVALSEQSAVTRDDAIRQLNMEVLGGRGPDILLLDGLPVRSYIEKGLLADLSGDVGPLIDEGTLLAGIAGAFAEGGTLPAVPLRFLMPTLWGDGADGLRTLSDVAAKAAQNPAVRPFARLTPASLIDRFYLSCAPAWYDGNGLLRRDAIEEFLAVLGALREPFAGEDDTEPLDGEQDALGDWNPYDASYGDDLMGAMRYAYDSTLLFDGLLRSGNSMGFPFGAITQAGKGGFGPMPGQAQDVFVPCGVVGVNAGGANAPLAREFVKIALEAGPQRTATEAGLPVRLDALEHQMSQTETNISGGVSDEEHALYTLWPDEAARGRMLEIAQSLKTPVIPDARIRQILIEESRDFFAGETEAGQAAANIAAKANAYLAE